MQPAFQSGRSMVGQRTLPCSSGSVPDPSPSGSLS